MQIIQKHKVKPCSSATRMRCLARKFHIAICKVSIYVAICKVDLAVSGAGAGLAQWRRGWGTCMEPWLGGAQPAPASGGLGPCGWARRELFSFSFGIFNQITAGAVMHHCISAEHIKAGPREGTNIPPFKQALMTSSLQVTGHV